MNKHIIFDLDGTLIDSMWVWDNLDSEFLQLYGRQTTAEIKAAIRTMSVKQSAVYFKEMLGLGCSTEEIIRRLQQLGEEKYRTQVKLKPYVKEYLRSLKDRNAKMCIATASPREKVLHTLERLRIGEFFDFIIAGDDLDTGKEDPEIYLKCAKRFGAEPEAITVFEDALHAIRTAKEAGFRVIGVFDESSRDHMEEIKEISDQYIYGFNEMGDYK